MSPESPKLNNYKEQPELETPKQKLSPEMEKHFESLLDVTDEHYCWFERQTDWETFQRAWHSLGISCEEKKKILEARKLWIEMKRDGEAFNEFFANKIRNTLNSQKNHEAYKYLHIYVGLNGTNDYKFFAEMLDHKTVWAYYDGSCMSNLLEYLGKSKQPSAASAITKYIEHALSPEYNRKDHLDYDLCKAARALKNIFGPKKTHDILQELAEKDQTLKGWFEKHKLAIQSRDMSIGLENDDLTPEPFDLDIENKRLTELEKELEKSKKNPPPPEYDSAIYDQLYKPYVKTLDEDIGTHGTEQWEGQQEKLFNFYGRFKPKIEEPVEITQENYLAGILTTVRNPKKSADPENYLGILNGVISKKDSLAEIGKIETIEEIYKIATVTFARSLSVAILDNKIDDAVSEINYVEDFINKTAENFDNHTDNIFIGSLETSLARLRESLNNLKENPIPTQLPKSADAFLIVHPSLKRVREIPDFRQLLAEKIKWHLANDLAHNMNEVKTGPTFERLREIIDEYKAGIELYKQVETQDVPVYWDARSALLNDFGSKRNVVFGRDGRYFFTALKASEFGHKEAKQRYVVITRPMVRGSAQSKEAVAKYLKQNGVTLDFTFIDTGFQGSIPEYAIHCLADAAGAQLSLDDIDKRIKLLSSIKTGRGQLIRQTGPKTSATDIVHIIETRPKNIDCPQALIVDKDGKIKPAIRAASINEQLRAWIVEHVSFRNFAPKLDFNHPSIELKMSPQTLKHWREKGLVPKQATEKTLVKLKKNLKTFFKKVP